MGYCMARFAESVDTTAMKNPQGDISLYSNDVLLDAASCCPLVSCQQLTASMLPRSITDLPAACKDAAKTMVVWQKEALQFQLNGAS